MATIALLIPGLVGLFLAFRPDLMKRYYETHRPVFGSGYPSYPMIGIRLCGVMLIAASVVLVLRFE